MSPVNSLEIYRQIVDGDASTPGMKTDDQRGISVILLYSALLFVLIGWAGRMKADFHFRAEIGTTAFIVAAILAGLAVLLFVLSLNKRRE